MNPRLFKEIQHTYKVNKITYGVSFTLSAISNFCGCLLNFGDAKKNVALCVFSIIAFGFGWHKLLLGTDPYTLLLDHMDDSEKLDFLADKNLQNKLCQEVGEDIIENNSSTQTNTLRM